MRSLLTRLAPIPFFTFVVNRPFVNPLSFFVSQNRNYSQSGINISVEKRRQPRRPRRAHVRSDSRAADRYICATCTRDERAFVPTRFPLLSHFVASIYSYLCFYAEDRVLRLRGVRVLDLPRTGGINQAIVGFPR